MIPNALSVSRGLLALPFAVWMASPGRSAALWAAAALLLAIASDLLDGAVARRSGTQSALGRSLDHGADCGFVLAGLVGCALRDVLPWLLPLAVALAFAQYVVDSYWLHRAGNLRMSGLGRWNGILYFVPLVGDVLVRLGVGPLAPALPVLAWGLVASTVASMADRALSLRASGR